MNNECKGCDKFELSVREATLDIIQEHLGGWAYDFGGWLGEELGWSDEDLELVKKELQ